MIKSKPKKIMLLPISAGGGHIAMAKALQQALERLDPTCQVENIDVLEQAPLLRSVYKNWYNYFSKHLPEVYGYFYKTMEKNHWGDKLLNKPGVIFQDMNARKLLRRLKEFSPDIIVSFHPVTEGLVGYWKKRGRTKAYHAVVTSDYCSHRYWVQPGVNVFYVACDEVGYFLEANGIDRRRLKNFGIPVAPVFYERQNRRLILDDLNLDPHKKTLLYYGLGFELHTALRVFKQILAEKISINIIALAGCDEKFSIGMKEISQNHPLVKVLGFVNNIHELMEASDVLISKSGGSTVTEALIKDLPMIIFNPIPGQEQFNAIYLSEQGVAKQASSEELIIYKLKQILGDKKVLSLIKKNISLLKPNRAAFHIAEDLLQ